MKTNKNLKLFLLLVLSAGISAVFGMNHQKNMDAGFFLTDSQRESLRTRRNKNIKNYEEIKPFFDKINETSETIAIEKNSTQTITTKEMISDQWASLKFLDKNNRELFYLEYSLKHPTTIYLNYILIHDRENRRKGYGKELLTYLINKVKQENPGITHINLTAASKDPEYLSQEKLENWYEKLNFKNIQAIRSYHNGFWLDINNFTPCDISNLLLLTKEINEFSLISSENTIEIRDIITHTHATIKYVITIKNRTQAEINIKSLSITKNFPVNKNKLEKQLKYLILKDVARKKWLKNCDFKTCLFFTELQKKRAIKQIKQKNKEIQDIFFRSML